jgi:hypothetical protein
MLEEQIGVCEKHQIATATAESAAYSSGIRVPLRASKSGEILETTIPQLGNFEFDDEKGSPIPDDVKALSGCSIRITGYMIPMDMDTSGNIAKFALVPMPPLHRQAQVQRMIVVTCPKGKSVKYSDDQITVEGKLTVEADKEEGYIVSIFQMETTSVKPVPK